MWIYPHWTHSHWVMQFSPISWAYRSETVVLSSSTSRRSCWASFSFFCRPSGLSQSSHCSATGGGAAEDTQMDTVSHCWYYANNTTELIGVLHDKNGSTTSTIQPPRNHKHWQIIFPMILMLCLERYYFSFWINLQ